MHKDKLVGLCIVHRNHNYGSILQSYATIAELEALGIDYEIINYSHPKSIKFYIRALGRLRSKDTLYSKMRSFKRKMGKKLHPDYARNDSVRARKFDDFISTRFSNYSKPLHSYEELCRYSRKYSDVLVGSDQLWLPSGMDTNFYNLMFVPDEINKIAYAASFGVSDIPNFQKEKTKEYLERIQFISLREESGQRIVNALTGRFAPVILDPTMVLTKEQWDSKIEYHRIVEDDYIFCYFLGKNAEQRKEVVKLSHETGLKTVVLRHLDEYIADDEKFGDIALYDVGPSEFVNLIRYAKYVCTDSFHGSVFSIIYHKQFISFNRYKEGANSRNSRLDTLFANIGVSRKYRSDLLSEIEKKIEWGEVDKRLEELRLSSETYIKEALGIFDNVPQTIEERNPIICNESECTGCSICSESCNYQAISMQLDSCGFWRPVINRNLCVECGCCSRMCPVNFAPETYGPTTAYAFQEDDSVRLASTSGGFFHALAMKTIAEGGVVCGAAFDNDMILRHVIVDKEEQLEPLQRSKYVQSSVEGVYREIETILENGRKVLFVGLGCQAAALRKYIGDHPSLIIIDLVCYGVPSSGLFNDWIKYLEAKYDKVQDVRFRDKSYGYASPNVKVMFHSAKPIENCRDSTMFSHLFFRHLSVRESCFNCHFKSIDRTSDITLGDLWLSGDYKNVKDDNLGTTAVFAHTLKGKKICRMLCKTEIEVSTVISKDSRKMVECIRPAKGASGFWKKYQEDGFVSLVDTYEKKTMSATAKRIVRGCMNKTGLTKMYYKRKKRKNLG